MEHTDYAALGERVYASKLPNGLQILALRRPEYSRQFAFFATRYRDKASSCFSI